MEFYMTGTFILDSPIITVDNTEKLLTGLNIYSSYFPVCTKILSVTNGTEFIVTEKSNADGTGVIYIADMPPYKYQERCDARKEVQDIINKEGTLVNIILRQESDITRDSYNSIIEKTQNVSFWIKAMPVLENPVKNQIEDTGLKQESTIKITTAFNDWLDNNYTIDDIILNRSTVKYDGKTFKIIDKNAIPRIANTYLYIELNLREE